MLNSVTLQFKNSQLLRDLMMLHNLQHATLLLVTDYFTGKSTSLIYMIYDHHFLT